MAAPPPISVLLPVRNGQSVLPVALSSLANQTFPDFEVLVVDDGSTDGTPDLVRDASGGDPRIRLLTQEPRGIVAALELARAGAGGKYLARMDADDEALPDRFQSQMDLMASDRRLVLCGSEVVYFPADSVRDGARRYQEWINGLTTHEAMERDLFVECPVPHPTFLLRADSVDLVGGYKDRGWPEDYDLTFRLWAAGGRLGKVPRVLLRWREGPERLSRKAAAYAEESFRRCKVHYLLRSHLPRDRGVVVWGAGPVGKAFARELDRQGATLRAFVDLDPRKVGQEVHGVPVIHPDAVGGHTRSFHVAAVGKGDARREIRDALRLAGMVELEDFVAVA